MSFPSLEMPAKSGGHGARWFAVVLTVLFLVIAGIVAMHHEFWRDEAQAWLIARDMPTLSALLEQAHYEGAPPLWSLLLRPLALLTPGWPEAMQVLTWMMAGAMVFIFVRFAPFSRVHKILIVANYYLLFQYGIVCRNYLPGLLCLSIACALYPAARRSPWGFTLALVGAGLASVHSLIVAMALGAGFWLEWGWSAWRERRQPGKLAELTKQWPALVALAAGFGVAVYGMLPRADTLYGPASGWATDWNPYRLAKVGWAMVNAYFPTPRPPGFFWIPPWDVPFVSFDPVWGFAPVALGMALVAVFLFRRHTGALLFYIIGTMGVVAFLYLKYLGFSRHTGFLFFTFLFAMWIKRNAEAAAGLPRSWSDYVAGTVLTVMLAIQAVTGLWAVREDYEHPFSAGKATAQYIRDHHLQDDVIVVGPDWAGSPLAAYLNRSFYYPHAHRNGSFTRWDTHRQDNMSDEEFLQLATAEAKGADMVMALDHPLPADLMQKYGVEFLAHIGGSLTPFEDYFLHFAPGKQSKGTLKAP